MACRTDTLPHFLTDVADAIRAKAGTSGTIQASTFDTAIANIPSGTTEPAEKDVNFYDADGTRLYSYTKTEFLALTSMPDVPTKDGLTSQGWNWSLSGAKEYVTDYTELDIGAIYVTNDAKTRIYISLDTYLSPTLAVEVSGTATINWGDNSTEETVSGNAFALEHTYSNPGDYVITISHTKTLYFGWNTTPLLSNSTFDYDLYDFVNGPLDYVYANCVKKIEFGGSQGNIIEVNDYALYRLYSLEKVTLSNYTTLTNASASGRAFDECHLKTIVLNDNCVIVQTFTNSQLKKIVFSENYSGNLKTQVSLFSKINIPKNTTFSTSTFSNNYYISHFIIPSTIANIPATCFSNCKAKYYDFSHHTSVPTLANKSGFTNIVPGTEIRVPQALVDEWKAATNWSNYASYIVGV